MKKPATSRPGQPSRPAQEQVPMPEADAPVSRSNAPDLGQDNGRQARELKIIRRFNRCLVRSEEENLLLDDICRLLCTEADYRCARVEYRERTTSMHLKPMAGFEVCVESEVVADQIRHRPGVTGLGERVLTSGKPVLVLKNDDDAFIDAALPSGCLGGMALPLKDEKGMVFGVFSVFTTRPDAFDCAEQSMLVSLSEDLSYGIGSLRLRRKHDDTAAELRRSEAHFRALFDRVRDGIYQSTPEGRFVDVNPAMVAMFGYGSKEEMMAVDIARDLYFSPEERDQVDEYTDAEGREILRMKRKDGREIWVEDHPLYEKDQEGRTLLHEGILRDITERRRVEEELRMAKERAEQSDRLKTAFLQNISHEFRTPMNAIHGFADLLHMEGITIDELQAYSLVAKDNVDKLLSILTDILTLSALETHQEVAQDEITCVNELIDEVKVFFREEAHRQNDVLHLSKPLDDQAAMVCTDAKMLGIILHNLVSNALKYTRNGHVSVGYVLRDDRLEFVVEDDGIGIPAEHHDLIFQRFRKVNDNSLLTDGGAGMGLSIAKGFVELLGGRIWVESGTGKGSVFRFFIPYRPYTP